MERRGENYLAKWISPVAIFPCASARDEDSELALARAFAGGRLNEVTRLYRHDRVTETDRWLAGQEWCLTYR